MATFTVERTYWVPVCQHITLEAESAEAAQRSALASDNWESAETIYDDSRAEHVTGCWEGGEPYCGDCLPIPADLQPGPAEAPAFPEEARDAA